MCGKLKNRQYMAQEGRACGGKAEKMGIVQKKSEKFFKIFGVLKNM